MQEPSLLEWLNSQLGQPRVQRLARFTLAGLAALMGLVRLVEAGGQDAAGVFLLGLSAGLFVWGMGVRVPAQPAGAGGGLRLPSLSLSVRPEARPAAPDRAAQREAMRRLLAGVRLPAAVLLAMVGQAALNRGERGLSTGLILYGLALIVFVTTVVYDRLLGPPPAVAVPVAATRLTFRWSLLAVALCAGAVTFIASGGNRFRVEGVTAWIVAVAAWLAATWDSSISPRQWWEVTRARVASAFDEQGLVLHVTRWALLMVLVLAVGAYFRFGQLSAIPP